jgi:hypothetical protein
MTQRTRHWRSPQTFSTREEHEAALAKSAKIGPQIGILVSHLVPPLELTPEELAAWAFIAPPDQCYPGWGRIPRFHGDHRTPWRKQDRGAVLARRVQGVGAFMIVPAGGIGDGWTATLLGLDPPIVEHAIIDAATGQPVNFGCESDAVRGLTGVVHADGGLPATWAFNPPLAPRRAPRWISDAAPGEGEDFPAISWQSPHCRWMVHGVGRCIYVSRDGKIVLNPTDQPLVFDSVGEAKSHCHQDDAP